MNWILELHSKMYLWISMIVAIIAWIWLGKICVFGFLDWLIELGESKRNTQPGQRDLVKAWRKSQKEIEQ